VNTGWELEEREGREIELFPIQVSQYRQVYKVSY